MAQFLEPIEPSRPTATASPPNPALWLMHLYVRPGWFFSYFPALATPFAAAYAALIVGVSEASSRVTEELVKRDLGGGSALSEAVLDSWTAYWGFCVLAGLVGALLYYRVGGWWYHVRLRWSGAIEPDKRLARRVYIFATLITGLPVLLLTMSDSLNYERPIDAERDGTWLWVFAVVFPFWSVYASYRGVRTLFDTVRWAARLWFLGLPTLFYVSVIGMSVLIPFLAAFGYVNLVPDVDHPARIDRAGFSLSYPSNWWVNEDDEEYDPDRYFTIAAFQDAAVTFLVSDGAVDAADETETMVQQLQVGFGRGPVSRFDRWGSQSGKGMQFEGESEGSHYRIRVFTIAAPSRAATIVEIIEKDVYDDVEPGLSLIRRTFAIKR